MGSRVRQLGKNGLGKNGLGKNGLGKNGAREAPLNEKGAPGGCVPGASEKEDLG